MNILKFYSDMEKLPLSPDGMVVRLEAVGELNIEDIPQELIDADTKYRGKDGHYPLLKKGKYICLVFSFNGMKGGRNVEIILKQLELRNLVFPKMVWNHGFGYFVTLRRKHITTLLQYEKKIREDFEIVIDDGTRGQTVSLE